MLKIPAEYDRDTSLTKFKDISHQLPASPLGVSAATRDLWWMTQERLELRWGHTIDQKMAAVHGTICTIPPRNSNEKHYSIHCFSIHF
jgi:hypothetical protein